MFKMVKLVNLFFDINNLTIQLRLTTLQVGFQNAKMLPVISTITWLIYHTIILRR